MMLQQTRMDVVLERFQSFVTRFPTFAALAAADENDVLAEWSGLGYYRRARMLHAASRVIVNEHGGQMPSEVESLRKLPGVGRYTAGAIGSIALDLRRPIADGNVLRVFSRLDCLDAPLGSRELESRVWIRAKEFVDASTSPRIANQSLMELGALICKTAQPLCGACPVADLCGANLANLVHTFPHPKKKISTITLHIPLLVVRLGDRFLFRKGSGRLMRDMWHLPHGSGALMPEMATTYSTGRPFGYVKHTVTNRRITFEVLEATIDSDAIAEGMDREWMTMEELLREPHPSYVRKALALVTPALRDSAPWTADL